MNTSFYITTPIYYVNDRPHIGHAYTTILADVLARYHRLLGDSTWFLTGTDEHGQKVQQASDARGVSPQEHVDETVTRFIDVWDRLEITNNDFIRTTEPRHTLVVQEILQDLFDRGEIYRDEYDGWYCVACERFYTEKDLKDQTCPECGRAVEQIREANYFFRMSAYQDWLIEHIENHPTFIQPDFRRNETLGFLRRPLGDLCISRPKSRMAWGIELPFDNEFVTYVWFDALVNYISAVGYRRDEERFNAHWPVSCHLIGKDILTTHTVYWPTMLKAMGLEMPKMIFAHGWWLSGSTKMSKSLGNVVNPMDMIDRFGVDAFRYFLISEMNLGQDASFTEELFIKRFNSDLANDLGNLANRVSNMITRYCKGEVPDPGAYVANEEAETLWNRLMEAVDAMEQGILTMKLNQGLSRVLDAVRETNRFLEIRQPWTLGKNGETELLHQTLYAGVEALHVCAGLLEPVMPGKMLDLCWSLGQSEASSTLSELRQRNRSRPGQSVKKIPPLFPRVELPSAEADSELKETPKMTENSSPKPPVEKPEEDNLITIDQFFQSELRTARVLEAEKIEGTDKLLKLAVMVGSERRQIVAGIARHYEAEALIGKTVVIVSNLKPAKLRGVESQGMLLAASKGESLRLITVDGEISSGAKVG